MPIKTSQWILSVENYEFTKLFVKVMKGYDQFSVVSRQNDTEPEMLIHDLIELSKDPSQTWSK